LQSGAQGFNFCLLGVDLLVENFIPGGGRLHGFVLPVKLAGDKRHFRAEDFETLVDIRERFFKLLFALHADFQAEIGTGHGNHLPSNPRRDDIVNGKGLLRLFHAEKLLVTRP